MFSLRGEKQKPESYSKTPTPTLLPFSKFHPKCLNLAIKALLQLHYLQNRKGDYLFFVLFYSSEHTC